jgi:hypothetical protein
MLNRGVANNFKKVVKREEVVAFDRHIITARTREHNKGVVDCCIPKILN